VGLKTALKVVSCVLVFSSITNFKTKKLMQELIEELKKMVDAGAKKSELEDSIGLPKNSLSAVLGGSKEMPESWIPKIRAYLTSPIAEPEKEPDVRSMSVSANGSLNLTPSKETLDRMNLAIEKINKDFGEGSVMRLGDSPMGNIEYIPTGSLGLDKALGIGGVPRGRIVEIYGPESSGKTTIAMHIIAEAQRLGGMCAMIDAEHAFDEKYAKSIGINVDELRISQPDYGEQALEEADRLIVTGAFSVIVIDSVAALVPKGELEGEMGDSKMGLQARLMSQACRKLTGTISKTNTVCIFINQLRATIGNPYAPSEITTGGQALKFYASVRLDVRRAAYLKDGDQAYGSRVRVKVVKNKVAPPFKQCEFDVVFGEGIDKLGEIVEVGADLEVINKSGSWYSYENSKLGQGKESVKSLLKDNQEMLQEIETKIKNKLVKE
jgi:recombination protein RecA